MGLTQLAHAQQQSLRGRWVTESQNRIKQLRKTDVRVIVLNAAGEPVEGAKVIIEQQAHDFPIGFTLTDADWPAQAGRALPLWRCFNAVSLAQLTDWAAMSPTRGDAPDMQPINRMLAQAAHHGMTVRWGGVMSADMGRNPSWLGDLDNRALSGAVLRRLHETLRGPDAPSAQYDVYTHALDHDFVGERFGAPFLRHLFEQAGALSPGAVMGVRFKDCLTGMRLRKMVRRVNALRQSFVPIDVVAVDQRITSPIVQKPLDRAMDWMDGMDINVVFVGLEVGGSSEAAAAFNLEVLLRTAFASSNDQGQPTVKGVWFGPLTPEQASAPNAALVDAQGNLTEPGRVVDRLFFDLWRTNEQYQTDLTGNVRTRIFTGTHRITAELPTGRTLRSTVHVPRRDTRRVIVLEPIKGESVPLTVPKRRAQPSRDGDDDSDQTQMDL